MSRLHPRGLHPSTDNGDVLTTVGGVVAWAPGGGVRVFNVKDYGAVGDGIADDTDAFTAAKDAADAAGGGIVYAPAGTYKITSAITWLTNVSLIGDGIDRTILAGDGADFTVIHNSTTYTLADPMENVLFQDFTIDGSAMTATSYSSAYKGFYIRFMRNCRWNRVKVIDTPATGFGVDFLFDCTFTDSIAEGCGRLNDGTQPGGAGFGIGTGSADEEAVTMLGCIARDNVRSGIFFERQTTGVAGVYSKYARVIGCHSVGNQYGIMNAGVREMVIANNTVADSDYEGIVVRKMLTDSRGTNTVITGNNVHGNSGHGIALDDTISGGTYVLGLSITDNVVTENTKRGISLSSTAATARVVNVDGNTVLSNGWSGIRVEGAGSVWEDVTIQNNGVHDNGTAAVSGEEDGIAFGRAVSLALVTGNNVSGHADHGFATTSNLTDVDLTGNQLEGNGSAYLASGTNTRVRLPGDDSGGGSGVGELLMQDGVTSPPVPVENEAGDDWLYEG